MTWLILVERILFCISNTVPDHPTSGTDQWDCPEGCLPASQWHFDTFWHLNNIWPLSNILRLRNYICYNTSEYMYNVKLIRYQFCCIKCAFRHIISFQGLRPKMLETPKIVKTLKEPKRPKRVPWEIEPNLSSERAVHEEDNPFFLFAYIPTHVKIYKWGLESEESRVILSSMYACS
jgi:hypothetical protein